MRWRGATLCLLLLTVSLVGCVDGQQPAPPTDPPSATPSASAPELAPGTAWTYDAHGLWDLNDRFTVVVADSDEDGYLFAGQHPQDLLGEVYLDRAWFGQRDAELNREPTRMHPQGWRLFDFPLEDDKTWYRGQQLVTAHAEQVPVPNGTVAGYRMEIGEPGGAFHITYTYAPSVGYLTSYTYHWKGTTVFNIQLAEVGTADQWTWYRVGPVQETTAPTGVAAQSFRLEAGYDAVVVYAGGHQGTRALLQPPAPSLDTWTYTVEEEVLAFTGEVLPGQAGTWTATLDRAEDGSGYLALIGVRWQQAALR